MKLFPASIKCGCYLSQFELPLLPPICAMQKNASLTRVAHGILQKILDRNFFV